MNEKKKRKKKEVRVNLTRRDILTVGVAAAGSAVVAPLITSGPLSPFSGLKQQIIEGQESGHEEHPHGEYHWGMIIDLDRCIGCEYCLRACSAVNDVNPEEPWNIVVDEETSAGVPFFFSRPCLHCQHAPCVEVCPVQATYHREDGLVVMDYDRCIGCRYCEVACPYDARRFNWQAPLYENPYVPTWGVPEVDRRPRGVVEKCTFCIQRIDKGLEAGKMPGVDYEATPACVNVCPVDARIFGDLNDPESEISNIVSENPTIRLREDLGTDPSVYYIPPEEGL
ncbi:MAG: sulfate reduction electron transfer complex DsrMKJOP subunit DsrO [Anaerolineales bacterium]|jgi:molybdopterin-containing oxidoreductase family iron-sulfur binding subunit